MSATTPTTSAKEMAMKSATSFSLAARGLRLDDATSLEPHLTPLTSNLSTITTIDLSGNTLGAPACAHIGSILPSLPNLHTLDLHDIFTGRMLSEIPPSMDSLVDGILKCPKLEIIDLSDNAFGLKTVEPLVRLLGEWVQGRVLLLNNNGMGPIAGSMIADALASLASKKTAAKSSEKNTPALEQIVCGRNRLESGSMKSWSAAFKAHSHSIRSVKMTQNGIRPEGIVQLLSGLSTCQNLEVLDLQDNTFTHVGARALTSCISKWPKLKELGLSDLLLGARASKALFDELAKGSNKEIEVLKLDFNDIRPEGVKALLQAVKTGLPKCRRIELNGNKFEEDDESVLALQALLSERREEMGREGDGEEMWGVGDLDELEGEDSDEDEEEDFGTGDAEDEDEEEDKEVKETREGEEQRQQLAEKVVDDADKVEEQEVSQKKDGDVDELADMLGSKVQISR